MTRHPIRRQSGNGHSWQENLLFRSWTVTTSASSDTLRTVGKPRCVFGGSCSLIRKTALSPLANGNWWSVRGRNVYKTRNPKRRRDRRNYVKITINVRENVGRCINFICKNVKWILMRFETCERIHWQLPSTSFGLRSNGTVRNVFLRFPSFFRLGGFSVASERLAPASNHRTEHRNRTCAGAELEDNRREGSKTSLGSLEEMTTLAAWTLKSLLFRPRIALAE